MWKTYFWNQKPSCQWKEILADQVDLQVLEVLVVLFLQRHWLQVHPYLLSVPECSEEEAMKREYLFYNTHSDEVFLWLKWKWFSNED